MMEKRFVLTVDQESQTPVHKRAVEGEVLWVSHQEIYQWGEDIH